MRNPVAQNKNPGIACQHQVEHDMAMAKDKIIDMFVLAQILLGENNKMLSILAHELGKFIAIQPRFATPPMGKTRREIGMNPTESTLCPPAMEETRHETIATIVIAQTIAMSQIELPALQADHLGRVMNDCTGLAPEIIEDPNIVIARKPMDLNAAICHLAQLTQETRETSWHHVAILKPIVDHIAHQIEPLTIVHYRIEEAHHPPLERKRIGHRACPQMHITDKVNLAHPAPISEEAEFELCLFGHHVLIPLRLEDQLHFARRDFAQTLYFHAQILHQEVGFGA